MTATGNTSTTSRGPREVVPGLWALALGREADEPTSRTYLLEEPDGFVLIDPGWASPLSERNLAAAVAELGFDFERLRLSLCTHCHPDHYGLAPVLAERTGAEAALHGADAAMIGVRDEGFLSLLASWGRWLRDAGVPESDLGQLQGDNRFVRRTYTAPLPSFLLVDGQDLPLANWRLKVLHTPGHSAGHLCFFEHRHGLLFTGDALLGSGSATVSSYPGSPPNPIAGQRRSLRRLAQSEARLVLPGHGEPFSDVVARVEAELAALDAALEHTEETLAARGEATVWQVAVRVNEARWLELSGTDRSSALTETAARLEALEGEGRARQTGIGPRRWRRLKGQRPN